MIGQRGMKRWISSTESKNRGSAHGCNSRNQTYQNKCQHCGSVSHVWAVSKSCPFVLAYWTCATNSHWFPVPLVLVCCQIPCISLQIGSGVFFSWCYTATFTCGGHFYTWRLPKVRVPKIIHVNCVFHYKPSILGYPNLWKLTCTIQTHKYIIIYIHI